MNNRKIVHCRKGEFDQLVDRTTIYGNPFVIGKDGTRTQVIAKFKDWVKTQPNLIIEIKKLRGKTLACWCDYPKEDCHASIIWDIANSVVDEEFD